jgi:hypothetical protein
LPDNIPALRFRWSGHSPKVERKIGIGRLMAEMPVPLLRTGKSLLCLKEKGLEFMISKYLDDALMVRRVARSLSKNAFEKVLER